MVEKFVQLDGLRIRYLEEGTGPAAILLHGASLGSSADVWERNLGPLARHGLRAIAFDQPGFGLSDNPKDYSVAYRRRFILQFMDGLGINKGSLVGHSQAGAMAVGLAFDHSDRISKVIILATGSVLPPLPEGGKQGAGEGEEGGNSEPTLADARALLEHNLFNHSLITEEVLQKRHGMSIGKNFQAFQERSKLPRGGGKESVPIWERLHQLPVPLLMIYGKQDRGSAAQRAALLKERYPQLNMHLLDRCKHLAQWDAASEFVSLSGKFLTS
ncbi:MAG: alpha/beta fold hydrolase [Deltaproteobacteria bacterium]|nr:MAG: alpha/beta fold hydrolase [Deltaproteobacteria bacterium]